MKFLNGQLPVSPRYMPSFVYPYPEEYTSDTIANGLFQGPLLLRVSPTLILMLYMAQVTDR